ncbi:MAG: lysophospholipid acyltransferase family protein [Candidatus Omnitrophota bacterium]|nr:lysophospholipid acyltransferase family protein [Candidatus Omnitrophota bacterium]
MKFKIRRYFIYYIGRMIAFIFTVIPLKIGLAIASALGTFVFYILPRYRDLTIDNLRSAFGSEKSDAELKDIAKRVFQNLGKNAVELVNLPRFNKARMDKFVRFANRERLDRAYEKGKGVIVLTAHLGSWELMAAALREYGYPGVTIGRRIYFKKYDDFLNKLRKSRDVEVIYRDDSPRKMLKTLKKNWIVGIVADQDVDSVDGVFVNFFGAQAYTPIGPAALAKASGAVLLPVFIIREGAWHTIAIDEPVELRNTGDKEADLIYNTQKWSYVVESYIRRYPDQWVWMHRRWKTKKQI